MSPLQATTRLPGTLKQSESVSDAELLNRFVKSGSESAFSELVQRHGRMVMATALRLVSDRHTAEDVFQATFLVLARDARKIRNHNSLAAWLHGVAWRFGKKSLRRRHRFPHREITMEPSTASPFRDIETAFEQQILDEELQRMPAIYRDALVLHFLEGLTYEQTAQALNVSVGTVEGRMKRAKRDLQVRLARRGVGLVLALAAMGWSRAMADCVVSSQLAESVTHGAMAISQGTAFPGNCSPEAVHFATKEAVMLTTGKLAMMGASIVLAATTGWVTAQSPQVGRGGASGSAAVATESHSDTLPDETAATSSAFLTQLSGDEARSGDEPAAVGLSGDAYGGAGNFPATQPNPNGPATGLDAATGSYRGQPRGSDPEFGQPVPTNTTAVPYPANNTAAEPQYPQNGRQPTPAYDPTATQPTPGYDPGSTQPTPAPRDSQQQPDFVRGRGARGSMGSSSASSMRAMPAGLRGSMGSSSAMSGMRGGSNMMMGGGMEEMNRPQIPLSTTTYSEEEKAIDDALKTSVQMQWRQTPLGDCLNYVSSEAGIPIVLDREAIEEEGATLDNQVSLELQTPIKLESALRLALKPLNLDYVIEDDVLKITSATEASEVLETRIYDVRAIVDEHGTGLIRGIMNATDAAWQDRDGEGGTLSYFRGSLLIRQTRRAHEQIEQVLEQLATQIAANPNFVDNAVFSSQYGGGMAPGMGSGGLGGGGDFGGSGGFGGGNMPGGLGGSGSSF